jgi:hypothetical protein
LGRHRRKTNHHLKVAVKRSLLEWGHNMSKATEDLQNLQSNQAKIVEVEGAVESAARLEDMIGDDVQAVPKADEEGQAEFDIAEGVALAAVSSFILGPLGILVGGAHMFAKRKADQGVLDKIDAQNTLIKASDDVYGDQFASLKASATESADIEKLGMIKALHTMARGKLLSTDPTSKAQGAQLMSGVDSALLNEFTRREDQEIARKAHTEQMAFELDDRQFSRNQTLLADFDKRSAGYLEVNGMVINLMGALQEGSPSDMIAAVNMAQRTVDPGGVVRPGDEKLWQSMGSFLETAQAFLQGQVTGDTFTAKQRRQMGDTFLRMGEENTRSQLQTEAEFSDRVLDADLPEKYHNNYRLVRNTPAAEKPDIPDDFIESAGERIARETTKIGATAEENRERFAKGLQEAWDQVKKEAGGFLDRHGSSRLRAQRDTNGS